MFATALMISFLMTAPDAVAEHPGCVSLDETYLDSGVVVGAGPGFKNGDPAFFSLAVFKQALPGLKPAKKMRLVIRKDEALLHATVIGESEMTLVFPVTCPQGTYTVRRSYGRSSAGEGVEQMGAEDVIEFFPDDCGITARVTYAGSYRVWPGFRKNEQSTVSYRFKRETACP